MATRKSTHIGRPSRSSNENARPSPRVTPRDEMISYYASLSETQRLSDAHEMAEELRAKNSRLYAVLDLLRDRMMAEDEEFESSAECMIVDLLEEQLRDTGQLNRLIDCLAP